MRDAIEQRRTAIDARRLKRTRAGAIRQIRRGAYRDFVVDGDTGAAAVRGSAYHALTKGSFRCERIGPFVVRVHRVVAS